MAISQRQAEMRSAEFNPATAGMPREGGHKPLELDMVTLTTRAMLDRVHARFMAHPTNTGPAMYELQLGLHQVKSRCSPDDWDRVVAECEAHPVAQFVWQDPFTKHSYDKPGGYAGDARLLDYLYGVAGAPAGTTMLGASVFGHMMQQQGALGVRARGDVLAQLIDETAERFEQPRILSIACGHLREGVRSKALMAGKVGELVALDQDADSLAEVERVYAGYPVRTMQCSVRAILSGKVKLEGFHFVYAAGLYDYLSERVAQRLTKLMFDMVVPDGRVLVANFAPGLPEVGYMESFMAWKLIYRTPEEMTRLSADVPGAEWKSHRVFWDASENIVFLDLVKRASRKHAAKLELTPDVAGAVKVPGMDHVSFGPAVRAAAPAEASD
jgi:extracellular factor (EF) 3-hydroxypalmitic acid methyl ester biosynthesis protein